MKDWQVIAVYAIIMALTVYVVFEYGRRAWRALKEWRHNEPPGDIEIRR